MERYRARDLWRVPGLLSLARVPLALAFVAALRHPPLELVILALAAITDVADGWWARRFNLVSATGAVVDPITDKLFVLTVVATLLATDRLSLLDVTLLASREIGELPLVVWWAVSSRRRRARVAQPMANVPGKVATSLQFVAVSLALFQSGHTRQAVWLAALAGVAAAASYWVRELRRGPGL